MEERGLLGQLLETFVYNELKRQASWNQLNIIRSRTIVYNIGGL